MEHFESVPATSRRFPICPSPTIAEDTKTLRVLPDRSRASAEDRQH